MRWTAIWQDGWPVIPSEGAARADAPVAEMTLCLECVMPPKKPGRTLRLWQGQGPDATALALYFTADGGLRLIHGGVDLATGPDFARAGETVLLHYRACARGRHDFALFRNADRDTALRARAAVAQTFRPRDAMPRDPRFLTICHIAAIAPFGLSAPDLPGLAGDTRVETPTGPRVVADLRPGDPVLTADGTARPVQWIDARPRLSLGRLSPVRLKAPYFGLGADLVVTPQTRVQRSGPTVEYIFGHDVVLVRVQDLIAAPIARRDRITPVRVFYHLMLDDPACLMIDRCAVETAALGDVVAADGLQARPHLDAAPVWPTLDRAGAQALASATISRRAAG